MTVADLIAALSALPSDLDVLVNGYEGGLEGALPPRLVKIIRDVTDEEDRGWWGPHELSDTGEPAVLIARRNT